MKILHTSDWHLGKNLHDFSLLEDQNYFLDQLIEYLQNETHDALLIAGDIFDRSVPSSESVKLLSRFLFKFREKIDIPVVMIPGNHDSAARLSYLSSVIEQLNIHIRCSVDDIDRPVIVKKDDLTIAIYGVPFLDPHQTVTKNPDEKKRVRTHEDALKEACEKIYKKMKDDNFNIFLGHLFTAGSIASDSERIFIGTGGQVDAGIFSRFDFTALGHLHRPQQPSDSIYYSGSPLKYSFSESNDVKHLLSISISADKSYSVNKVEISPLRNMSRICGNIDDLLSNKKFEKYTDHYLEITLEDRGIVNEAARRLKERFNRVLSIRQSETIMNEGAIINEHQGKGSIIDEFLSFEKYLYGDEIENLNEKKKLLEKYYGDIS